jgi:hypothetical protein
MRITIRQSNQLKAILMMLFLYLFNRVYIGLFEPLQFIILVLLFIFNSYIINFINFFLPKNI